MARYAVELVRGLAARGDMRVVPIATRTVLDSFSDVDVFDTIALPDGQLRETGTLRFRLGPALDGGVDVFHGTRHLLPARCPVPSLVTIHDVLLLDDRRAYDAPKRWFLPTFLRRSLQEADAVVCVSRTTRDRLLRHLPGLAGRAEVVPTGVASGVLAAESEPVTAAERFALYVGDLSPRKNVPFLLDLWPTIHERHGVELLLVGPDGWRSDAVRERLHAGVRGVRRLGLVSDGRLRWLYENAAVVVIPSLYEGTGLPVAEALMLGAPVIANCEAALVETSGGRARHIPVSDPSSWTNAIVEALQQPRSPTATMTEPTGWIDAMAAIYRRLAGAAR